MSFPQTAGGVTAGVQTQYGATTVENAAQGVFARGIPPVQFGLHLVSDQIRLSFDFVDLGNPVLALHFVFSGPNLLRPVGLDSFRAGRTALEGDQSIYAIGFRPPMFGLSLVADRPPLEFDFVELGNPLLALQFNFDGPQMLTSAGGADFSRFGKALVVTPQSFAPTGTNFLRFGLYLVADRPPLEFDFVELGNPVLALQFNFDGPQMLTSVGGVDFLQFGLNEASNTALGIFSRGKISTTFGLHTFGNRPKLYFEFADAAAYMQLPIQFYFGHPNDRQFRPAGWDSSQISPWTSLSIPPWFRPAGWDSSQISPWALVWKLPWFEIRPVGLSATQWGNNKVSPLIIYAHGNSLTQYGNAAIWREGEIQFFGRDSLAFGSLQAVTDSRIRPVGLNATRWGLIHFEYIPLEDKYIAPMGFHPGGLGLEAVVSNWWRLLWMPDADRKTAYGTPFVDFRIRYVDAFQGINSFETGEFQVGFHQDVEAIGRDHSEFGLAEIKIRHIYVFGFDGLTFGPPYDMRVSFGQQYLDTRGFRPRDYGEPYVWNLTQIIQFRPLCPEPTLPDWCDTEWGQEHHTHVLNRNRHIYPYGTVMTRFAFRVALIMNTGRALLMRSEDPENFGPWYEKHMISHYVRYLPMPGLDSFRIVTYHAIHNAAQAIYPVGLDATEYGNFRYALTRWLYQWGIWHDEHGQPWVSFSPRYVQIYSNRDSSRFSHPFVAYGVRGLEPEGIRSSAHAFIGPYLTQKPVPTITPRWIWDEYRMGTPAVKNNTPQLFVFGKLMFDSIPQYNWVSHSPRYIGPQGWQTTTYGKADWVFRNRTIYMGTHVSSRVPQNFRVENKDPSPIIPSLQTVFMSDVCQYSAQHQGRCSGTGYPAVRTNVLRPVGNSFLGVGVPAAQSNGIIFSAWHQANTLGLTEWGIPSLNRPQNIWLGKFRRSPTANEQGDSYGIPPSSTPPKARVSPHTIWMRLDTPQQAKDNHPGKPFCEVDNYCGPGTGTPYGNHEGPYFGSIRVRPEPGIQAGITVVCAQSFGPNTLACHRLFLRVGEPKIENFNRAIPVDGWRSVQFGFPTVVTPFTQIVEVWGSANTGSRFGTAYVYDLGPRFALNVSLGLAFRAGTTHIENFHREVYPVGLNATKWGNNNPMVHFPRRLTPLNTDMTQYGTTWVSHSPRWVEMKGADMFQSWWTLLNDRMRVRRMRDIIRGYNFSIMTEWGEAAVSQADAEISPYGIAAPCVSPHVTVEHG